MAAHLLFNVEFCVLSLVTLFTLSLSTCTVSAVEVRERFKSFTKKRKKRKILSIELYGYRRRGGDSTWTTEQKLSGRRSLSWSIFLSFLFHFYFAFWVSRKSKIVLLTHWGPAGGLSAFKEQDPIVLFAPNLLTNNYCTNWYTAQGGVTCWCSVARRRVIIDWITNVYRREGEKPSSQIKLRRERLNLLLLPSLYPMDERERGVWDGRRFIFHLRSLQERRWLRHHTAGNTEENKMKPGIGKKRRKRRKWRLDVRDTALPSLFPPHTSCSPRSSLSIDPERSAGCNEKIRGVHNGLVAPSTNEKYFFFFFGGE